MRRRREAPSRKRNPPRVRPPEPRPARLSDILRHHLEHTARTFGHAQAAALATVVFELGINDQHRFFLLPIFTKTIATLKSNWRDSFAAINEETGAIIESLNNQKTRLLSPPHYVRRMTTDVRPVLRPAISLPVSSISISIVPKLAWTISDASQRPIPWPDTPERLEPR